MSNKVNHSDILDARILVVDDHLDNLEVLGRILRSAGYTSVVLTANPLEVCALHRQHRFALIMLDLDMPQLHGFQVMEGIEQIESAEGGYLPVFVITANPAQKLRALELGAKDFLSKPVDPSELLRRVYNLLEVRLLHEALRSQSKRLESFAWQDPLTGLANRRLLLDRLSLALAQARRSEGHLMVMYFDLDGFKRVNDTLGHGGGDALLKAVAQRLIRTVREEDTVARVGGDEFVATFRHIVTDTDAAAMAAKVVDAVAQPYLIEGRIVDITISAGIAIYPGGGDDVESLLQSADSALYQAKRAGKNSYRISTKQNGPS